MKRFLSLMLACFLFLSLAGAALADQYYADGTTLRMATGYNSAKTGITFEAGRHTDRNLRRRRCSRS